MAYTRQIPIYGWHSGKARPFPDHILSIGGSGPGDQLGPNLLVDWDMEELGVGSWTVVSGTITKSLVNPFAGVRSLQIRDTGAANGVVRQDVLPIGPTIRIEGWYISDGVGIFRVRNPGPGDVFVAPSAPTVWTFFSVDFISASVQCIFRCIDDGQWVKIDNIMVRQVLNP